MINQQIDNGIYVTVKGGLGNLLFQFATLHGLELQTGRKVYVTNFEEHLKFLNDETSCNPLLNHSEEYMKLDVFKRIRTAAPPSYVEVFSIEDPSDPIPVNMKAVVVDNYTQHENYYLEKYENEIREYFQPSQEILQYIFSKYGKLFSRKCTSVHIRRGDYLKETSSYFLLPSDYYNKATQQVKSSTDYFLVFSDDLPWCKEVISGTNVVFIENERDYIELYMMSLCKNNIISNSSFGWWGAWLSVRSDKVIIAPSKWKRELAKLARMDSKTGEVEEFDVVLEGYSPHVDPNTYIYQKNWIHL